MTDPIERQDAIDALDCINGVEEVLRSLPSAQKTGHWFLLDECSNAGVYCSVCNKKVFREDYANQKIKSKYCPNCGARMEVQIYGTAECMKGEEDEL